MEWRDKAVVLAGKAQGENHSLLTVFAREHGKVAALVYGGQGRQKLPILQCGNGLDLAWRGKTPDALGHFDVELTEPRAAAAMSSRLSLELLTMIAELLLHVLPEGEGHEGLFDATSVLLDQSGDKTIFAVLLPRWEIGLLSALGAGLTLDRCVATGEMLEDGAELCFVSPKSGGAVSYKAGLPYKEKLFPLPPFLIGMGEPTEEDVAAALRLTGHFVEERLLLPLGREMPASRQGLASRLGLPQGRHGFAR
ncbi:MAG: DNA repair protein RecO [Parvularcula sp.]|jgi:DNA repair protein RecO (recombination protein O)|nr:DNA repair protein RecO [Parvularcula sp.]